MQRGNVITSYQPEFVVTMPHQPHKQQGWGEYYHLLHSAS